MTWGEKNYPNVTPWFQMKTPPVRPGVYMVDQSWPGQLPQEVFSFWDGNSWYPQDSAPEKAMRWVCYGPKKGAFRRWRGLKGEE